MSKAELAAKVAEKCGMSKKDAAAAVNAVLEEITATLVAGESVQLIGFGTFEVKKRSARTGKNPRTGEIVEIAASKAPAFKPGKTLKDLVNN